jgi:hypothetical protein
MHSEFFLTVNFFIEIFTPIKFLSNIIQQNDKNGNRKMQDFTNSKDQQNVTKNGV